ncbi:MAG: hypothetical protein D6791_08505, partial [Chloroflexi bacterium]
MVGWIHSWMAERRDFWRRMKRVSVCVLAVVLAMVGCDPRTEPADPTPSFSSPVTTSATQKSPTARPEHGSEGVSERTGTPTSQAAARPTSHPTDQPTSQPANQPSNHPAIQPTSYPTAQPNVLIPSLRRLTTGGCCTQPFWSPDSRQVLFIDRPAPDAPVGIWGVDVTQPQSAPELVTERIGFYTGDMAFIIEPGREVTVIE